MYPYPPHEPTQPIQPYYPYSPPPSPRRNNKWLITALVLSSLFGLFGGTLAFVTWIQHQPSPSVLIPTSTAVDSLHSSDFPTFLNAFSLLLAQRDYATLQSVVDTENFQALYMVPEPEVYAPANPGPYDWQTINHELVLGRIFFTISSPLVTADQAGYSSCFGYDQTGITSKGMAITAQVLQFIVGTLKSGPGYFTSDPEWTPNSTVFVFELPNGSSSWLWRAVTYNNALGCGY